MYNFGFGARYTTNKLMMLIKSNEKLMYDNLRPI
jgi:hypothetical protein